MPVIRHSSRVCQSVAIKKFDFLPEELNFCSDIGYQFVVCCDAVSKNLNLDTNETI